MVFAAFIDDVLQAHLLRGDALLSMGEYCAAEDAYAHALDLDPSIRRSKSFKVWIRDLPCRHYNFVFCGSYLI
jgi:predicted negative regulator of RcsB-dependent stress response